jgi:hypothetical protein
VAFQAFVKLLVHLMVVQDEHPVTCHFAKESPTVNLSHRKTVLLGTECRIEWDA